MVKLKFLGKGKFSEVYLCREKQTNFICAVKIVRLQTIQSEHMRKQVLEEIKIMLYVRHPNIVQCYGFCCDFAHLYIFMEYSPDGDLFKQQKMQINS